MTPARSPDLRLTERPTERVLETSEAEWVARYAQYAAQGLLYPQPEGSPLMEFAAQGGAQNSANGLVLYLLDRTGPYTAQPGPARVIVHGVLAETEMLAPKDLAENPPEERLFSESISAVEGVGRVLHASRLVWVVQARLPLVLGQFEALPDVAPGSWVRFRTAPPLHGFLVRGD